MFHVILGIGKRHEVYVCVVVGCFPRNIQKKDPNFGWEISNLMHFHGTFCHVEVISPVKHVQLVQVGIIFPMGFTCFGSQGWM